MLERDSSTSGKIILSYSAHGITHDWHFYIILNLRDYHVGLENDHSFYSPLNKYDINGIYKWWLDATIRSF